MAFIVYLALGMCVIGLLLALDGASNKKLDRKIKGKNVSMPNPRLLFGSKNKRR